MARQNSGSFTLAPSSPKNEPTNCILISFDYTEQDNDASAWKHSPAVRNTEPPDRPESMTDPSTHEALSERQRARRSYDDGCAAAHALDLVGDRWALLIVRELLLGPRRFSDIRQALRYISPNVLTQRLTDLESSGILRRETLPPPASCQVYRLTPWGESLEPVLLELLKWGVRSPAFQRGRPLTADAMALSLKGMFDPSLAGTLACRIVLEMNDNAYYVQVRDRQIGVCRGTAPCSPGEAPHWPDATLQAPPVTVLKLAYGKRPLQDAAAQGECRIKGDTAILQRFLSCFLVPPPMNA